VCGDVSEAIGKEQIPGLYIQFFDIACLGSPPETPTTAPEAELSKPPTPIPAPESPHTASVSAPKSEVPVFEHRHHIVTPPILPEMVFVGGGDFMMGIPKVEGGDNERPRHKVMVSPSCMGKYQVTQREYLDLMGTNPSHFKGDKLPVECELV